METVVEDVVAGVAETKVTVADAEHEVITAG